MLYGVGRFFADLCVALLAMLLVCGVVATRSALLGMRSGGSIRGKVSEGARVWWSWDAA